MLGVPSQNFHLTLFQFQSSWAHPSNRSMHLFSWLSDFPYEL
uniref:Uncharacterized protein n=1 Tax=Arundo donax TaxID=35708 RepID=A0A0A8YF98_ARUDO